jgi:hypothetical protein
MRILAETQVPGAIRLREAARKSVIETEDVTQLKEIRTLLHTISETLRVPPTPVVDLSPVTQALAAVVHPVVPPPPAPSTGWTFTIERDDDGLMTHIRASRTS